MARKPKKPLEVEALKHDDATRKNIPTAEFESICGIEAGKERVVGVVWYGYADGATPPPKKRKLAVDDVLVEVA